MMANEKSEWTIIIIVLLYGFSQMHSGFFFKANQLERTELEQRLHSSINHIALLNNKVEDD